MTGNSTKRNADSCRNADFQSAVSRAFSSLFFAFAAILLTIPLYAMEAAHYTLSGDNVFAETDESGGRHVKADGNVHLTYSTAGNTWQLSADSVEYIEKSENKTIVQQTALASGNVEITGPGITVTTPGAVSADILAGKIVSAGDKTHAIFENGDLTTDQLDITQTANPDGVQEIQVNTSVHTSGTYVLSKERLPGMSKPSGSQNSLFGALDFDFANIAIDTKRTSLLIRDGNPVRLDCPDPSLITSDLNKLTLPTCAITFNPTVLTGSDGVQIEIGEAGVNIKAGSMRVSYPPEGGMYIELSCGPTPPTPPTTPTQPSGSTGESENPEVCLPDRVTITHENSVFLADLLTVRISKDGAKKVEASGHTKLEMIMRELMKVGEGQK